MEETQGPGREHIPQNDLIGLVREPGYLYIGSKELLVQHTSQGTSISCQFLACYSRFQKEQSSVILRKQQPCTKMHTLADGLQHEKTKSSDRCGWITDSICHNGSIKSTHSPSGHRIQQISFSPLINLSTAFISPFSVSLSQRVMSLLVFCVTFCIIICQVITFCHKVSKSLCSSSGHV